MTSYLDLCRLPLHPAALKGLELFNIGEYYKAHEELEIAWREDHTEFRLVYQAILQVAVTFMHIKIANYVGAMELSEKAIKKLDQWQLVCRGIDLVLFRADFSRTMAEVYRLGPKNILTIESTYFHTIHYKLSNIQ